MMSLSCLDTGAGVTGCNYVARGRTEEELWVDATAHIIKEHGMKMRILLRSLKTIINNTSNIPKMSRSHLTVNQNSTVINNRSTEVTA